MKNTGVRVAELSEQIEEILASKELSRIDGEKVRGRLQFASGQVFGRSVRNQLRLLSCHIESGRRTLSAATHSALRLDTF